MLAFQILTLPIINYRFGDYRFADNHSFADYRYANYRFADNHRLPIINALLIIIALPKIALLIKALPIIALPIIALPIIALLIIALLIIAYHSALRQNITLRHIIALRRNLVLVTIYVPIYVRQFRFDNLPVTMYA